MLTPNTLNADLFIFNTTYTCRFVKTSEGPTLFSTNLKKSDKVPSSYSSDSSRCMYRGPNTKKIKESIRRTHIISIINTKRNYISTTITITNTSARTLTYTDRNPNTDSSFDTFESLINNADIQRTNFLSNF